MPDDQIPVDQIPAGELGLITCPPLRRVRRAILPGAGIVSVPPNREFERPVAA